MTITMFFDASSFIIILGSILITTFLTKSYKIFIMGINGLLSDKYQIMDDDKRQIILLFHLISRVVIGVGCIAVIINFSWILSVSTDVKIIYLNMRTGILPLFYAVIINTLLFYPAIYKFEKSQKREVFHEKENIQTKAKKDV